MKDWEKNIHLIAKSVEERAFFAGAPRDRASVEEETKKKHIWKRSHQIFRSSFIFIYPPDAGTKIIDIYSYHNKRRHDWNTNSRHYDTRENTFLFFWMVFFIPLQMVSTRLCNLIIFFIILLRLEFFPFFPTRWFAFGHLAVRISKKHCFFFFFTWCTECIRVWHLRERGSQCPSFRCFEIPSKLWKSTKGAKDEVNSFLGKTDEREYIFRLATCSVHTRVSHTDTHGITKASRNFLVNGRNTLLSRFLT